MKQLLAKQPSHQKLRFQLFSAHRTLGELRSTQANETDILKNPGFKNLESALEEINALVSDYPFNVDYVDAQNATKRNIAGHVAFENPSRALRILEEVAASSEQLWRQFPSKPLLVKHAIGGTSYMASLYLQMGDLQRACDTATKAVKLSDEAWGNLAEERWVVEETVPIFETAARAMLLNGSNTDSLAMLTRCHALTKGYEGGNAHADECRMRRFRLYALQINAAKAVEDAQSLEVAKQELTELLRTVKDTPRYAWYKTFSTAKGTTSPELDKLIAEN